MRRPVEAIDVDRRVDLQSLSVGFVDLVGSTTLANTLEPADLAAALTHFDASSSEIVTQHGGRVIKLIGDEVMFVAADADTAADVAVALVDALDTDDVLPPARASVASGEVVARDGDYSGPIVNLAARAVTVARPSSVLVDRATRDHLTDTVSSGGSVCTGCGVATNGGERDRRPADEQPSGIPARREPFVRWRCSI